MFVTQLHQCVISNNKCHTFSSLMVKCLLQDSFKGTALYIESNLLIHFNFNIRTKAHLTSSFLVYH